MLETNGFNSNMGSIYQVMCCYVLDKLYLDFHFVSFNNRNTHISKSNACRKKLKEFFSFNFFFEFTGCVKQNVLIFHYKEIIIKQ